MQNNTTPNSGPNRNPTAIQTIKSRLFIALRYLKSTFPAKLGLLSTAVLIPTLFIASAAYAVTVFLPAQGGTGTGVTPSYGQVLMGNGGGIYTPTATSSLGLSSAGSASGFSTTSADFWVSQRSTTNLSEGTNLYFTVARAISALTGQNISIFTNNSGYITLASLSATYPVQYAAGLFSLAFGTTTSNTWAGTQSFNSIAVTGIATSTISRGLEANLLAAPVLNATSSTATSTFAGGLNVAAINQTGSATSTFANGLKIAAGCFWFVSNCLQNIFAIGTGLTLSGGTLSNSGVTSIAPGSGISVSGSTGAVTVTNSIAYPFPNNATNTTLSLWGGLLSATATIGAVNATSTFRGAGLTDCAAAGNAVTWNGTTFQFGCNTITSSGSGFSTTSSDYYSSQYRDWRINGAGLLSPTSTRSIAVGGNSTSTFSAGVEASSIGSQYIIATSSTATSTFAGNVNITGNIFQNGLPLATTTTFIFIDSNRTDTYGADGTQQRPYKTITAANTGVTAKGLTSATYFIAPGSYTEQSITMPAIPLVVYGNNATITLLSGASVGAGRMTFSSDVDFYNPVIFGGLYLTASSLTNPHGIHNGLIAGNMYFAGNGTMDGSAMVDQSTASFPFLSQNASSTLIAGSGSLVAVSNSNIQTVVEAHGTLNLDIVNIQTSTSTRYAITATTTGSALRINGASIQNYGTGGGVNCSNGTSAANPNQISNVQITLGSGSTGAIDCGSATTFVGHYTAFTQAGTRLFSTGTDKQYPGMEGLLVDNRIGIASTTPGVPLAVTGAGVFTDTVTAPQYNATSTTQASLFNLLTVATTFTLAGQTGCATFAAGVLSGTGSACGSSSGLTSYDAWTHPAVGRSATTSTLVLSSGSLQASSTIGTLTATSSLNVPVSGILKGNGVASVVTAAVSGTDYVNGSGTNGNCVQWGASNALGDAGSPCGTGSGSGFSTTSTNFWYTQIGKLSTTSTPVAGNILTYSNTTGGVSNVATGTVSGSGGITATANQYIIGSGLTIGCTAATALVPGCIAAADWLNFNNKVATGTTFVSSNVAYFGSNGTLFNAATGTLSASSPLSLSNGTRSLIGGSDTLSIQNAAADGTTKGAASFTANDFDASTGNISLDYTNGQKATNAVPGFLSSADHLSFATKVATGTLFTSSNVPYWRSDGTLGDTATGTVSSSGGITTTASRSVLGGSLAISCDVASGSIPGCLSAADWTSFNNKASFGYPFPSNATTTQIAFNGGITYSSATGTNATTTSEFAIRLLANTAAFGQTGSTSISSAGVLTSPQLSVTNAAATSTFSGGLSVLNFAQTGTATSTHTSGITLSSGCYAVQNTCIGLNNLPGTVSNAQLANSSLTVNGTTISLGGSGTVTAASSSLLTDQNKWTALNVFTYASSTAFSGTALCIGSDCRTAWPTVAGSASTTLLTDFNTFGNTQTFNNLTVTGTCTGCGSGGGTYAFTPTTNFNTLTSATSSTMTLSAGLFASSTIRFGNAGVFGQFLWDGASGELGISTSTPWASLSVVNSGSQPAFAVGDVANNVQFLINRGGKVGIGTSTPWASFSVASTSPDYTNPIFMFATSSPFGPLVGGWATTSTLVSLQNPWNRPLDPGVRIGIGTTQTYDYPGLTDQLTVNGRVNTLDWRYIECAGFNAISSIADTVSACGQFSLQIDTQAGMGYQSGAPYTTSGISSPTLCISNTIPCSSTNTSSANAGAALVFPNTTFPFLIAATSTPVLESVARIATVQNASSTAIYIGFSNLNVSGTAFETEPTVGCYFNASSTAANWWAVCRTAAGNATFVNTGFASSTAITGTGSFYRFRLEMHNTDARFYMGTSTASFRMVAKISTNYPSTTALGAHVVISNVVAGLAKMLDVNAIKLWFFQPALNY